MDNKVKKVLTPFELKMILGIGMNTTYDLLKSGKIKSIRIGKKYVIPEAYLDEFLNIA